MLHKDYDRKGLVEEKNLWLWASRGLAPRLTDWRYTASRKVTLTLTSMVPNCAPQSAKDAAENFPTYEVYRIF
jgi:hypothetical protein